jgi:hypothetical protein
VVYVSFTIDPDFTIVAVQFKRAAVMPVGVSFMGDDDRRANTIRLEVHVDDCGVRGIDDAEDTSLTHGRQYFDFGADAVEDMDVYTWDLIG